MCGIVGVLSTEMNTNQHPYGKFFKQALYADTLRGADSTGIMVMDTAKMRQPEVYKKALAGYDFLQLARTNNLLRDTADWNVMIGHNRAATRGGIEHHTAHPFQIENITLVHNGTVSNHRTLKDGHKFDVDSEAIAYAIADVGIEEVVKKIDGAFTLIWHDEIDGSVNFIRNEERPLAFGKVKDKDTILLSSEGHMLRWLAVRNGLSLESIIEPKAGEQFTFWPYKDNKNWMNEPLIRKRELKPKYNYSNRGNGYYANGRWVETGGNNGKKSNASNSSNTGSGNSTGTTNVVSIDTKNRELTPEAKVILDTLGLEHKETVVMGNLAWEPYRSSKNQDVGRVVGILEDIRTLHQGVIHGVKKEQFEKELRGNFLYSEVNSATYNSHSLKEVFLNNQDYVVFEPGDLPEPSIIGNTEDQERFGEEEESKALIVATFRGPDGSPISLAAFEHATKEGCANCTGNIDPQDADKTGWTDQKQPICKHCISQDPEGLSKYLR